MEEWQKLRFEHASRYFATHAGQRLSLFQFALTFWAAIYAALGSSIQYDLASFRMAAASVGVAATLVFWLLDARTRQLIKISEAALQELEAGIASATGSKSIAILSRSDTRQMWPPSYSRSFLLIYMINLAVIPICGFPAASTQLSSWIASGLDGLVRLLS